MDTPDLSSLHDFQPSMPMMNSFAATPPQPTHAQLQQADNTDRARVYKSRNKRPCDFCRYKKAACHLDSHPPCELCIRYKKECTFVESPAKRRRPNENSENYHSRNNNGQSYNHERNGSAHSSTPFGNGHLSGSMDMQPDLMSWENGMTPFQMSMGMGGPLGDPDFPLDPAFYNEPGMGFDTFDPMSASATVNPMDNHFSPLDHGNSGDNNTSPHSSSSQIPFSFAVPLDANSVEPSLDLQSSSNCQIVGLSGESDPYLLSRYHYDQNQEASFQTIRIRKMSGGSGSANNIPTFFTIQHNALVAKAQPPERPETLDRYRRDVEDMVSDDVGRRLIRLFYRYLQPYFPVLGGEGPQYPGEDEVIHNPKNLPTCLLAAIYGHAIAFYAWDEKLCVEVYTPPSADALFRIAWLSVLPLLHTPCLATLQTLLLLVQRRPTNKHVSDTPFKAFIMAAAISIAHALGLNRDPSEWRLPAWEIKLRRRLAWATYVQDKWLALNFGRPSQIQADDWDVNPLKEEDFHNDDSKPDGLDSRSAIASQHFIRLCELTKIVDDILRELFSIKASKALHHSLEATLEVAKPLRLRLTEWYQHLPAGLFRQSSPQPPGSTRGNSQQHELDGNGSLHLAYITAKIELFRAMLRPPITDSTATAVSALRTGAMTVAREVIEFLEGLNARELEAFWASYARTNFTIASSFMLLLYVTSPNVVDAKECLALLNAWRSLLRINSRSSDLLNLALLRLDAVFVAGIDRLIELSPAAAQAWDESGQGMG